jgi:NADPH-dependent 2,4-dienoyl-CoA reductase/sulfur reductase-like enzyme
MKNYKYVILGGGVAAGYAAREFAQQQVEPGKTAIVTADTSIPYDRPPLSKGFLAGEMSPDDIVIEKPAFYREHGIQVLTRSLVGGIDFPKRTLNCQRNGKIKFEKLLIATGSEVKRLNVPGADLKGLFYLRSQRDSLSIRRQIGRGRRAVVIGAGFIGMEVASVLAKAGVSTTMIYPQQHIAPKLLTPEMAGWFQRYFEKRGVTLLSGRKVKTLLGKKNVRSVGLDSGEEVAADFVVAGIGITPATKPFEKTLLKIDDGILVNEFLATDCPDIWAAGDVANYPDTIFDKRRRLDHWDNAVEQGRCAVRNMVGKPQPFIHVPYLFSDVFDLSYEFWGDADGVDETVCRGKMASGKFSVWWLKNGRLMAAFVMGRPDKEREMAPKWIMERTKVNWKALED